MNNEKNTLKNSFRITAGVHGTGNRLHGMIGRETPEEIALAFQGEVVAARHGER